MQLTSVLLLLLLAFEVSICCGQGPSPVLWTFKAAPMHGHETTLIITAGIMPGWHLYSQSMKQGGPLPTRIDFETGDDYILRGITVEKGEAVSFYDDTYEMEITWYKGVVKYLQPVMLTKSAATIRGTIEYMTCNDELCIPGEQRFSISVSKKDSSPGNN